MRRKYIKSYGLWFVLLCIIVALIILASTGFIGHQLRTWKLLPEPERLTELYFTQPNGLPTTYTPGEVQKVSFTVHNTEYRTVTYQFDIFEQNQDGSKSQMLVARSFTLKQGQYWSGAYSVPLVDFGQQAEIMVKLPTVNESISYLVTRSNQ